jgi:hypothetical protein
MGNVEGAKLNAMNITPQLQCARRGFKKLLRMFAAGSVVHFDRPCNGLE